MSSFNHSKESNYEYYNSSASQRSKWKKRNRYYHKLIEKQYKFYIPDNSSVVEIGCSTGDLLASLNPKNGLGIDFAPQVIEIAKNKYPSLDFMIQDVENLNIEETFDYVIFFRFSLFLIH